MFAKLTRFLRRHAVGLTALFLLLGGTAFAAGDLPPNSVGPRQLENNAVTSSKVKNGSLQRSDFNPTQVPRLAVGSSRKFKLAPNGAAVLVAKCPRGTIPINGGVNADEFTDINHVPLVTEVLDEANKTSPQLSRPDSWFVLMGNLSSTDTYTVRSSVYCVDASSFGARQVSDRGRIGSFSRSHVMTRWAR